jgi:hypothetical protein
VEFDSEQKDLNRITVSPCETYVTASGTDGATVCWDKRNPNHILHVLKHGGIPPCHSFPGSSLSAL